MPKFEVLASQVIYLVRIVEADSKEQAWQIAIDDGEWKDYEATNITHIETVEIEEKTNA
jgi:hypothetical protein